MKYYSFNATRFYIINFNQLNDIKVRTLISSYSNMPLWDGSITRGAEAWSSIYIFWRLDSINNPRWFPNEICKWNIPLVAWASFYAQALFHQQCEHTPTNNWIHAIYISIVSFISICRKRQTTRTGNKGVSSHNSLLHSDNIWRHKIWSIFILLMTGRLFGAKALLEPMQVYCQFDI